MLSLENEGDLVFCFLINVITQKYGTSKILNAISGTFRCFVNFGRCYRPWGDHLGTYFFTISVQHPSSRVRRMDVIQLQHPKHSHSRQKTRRVYNIYTILRSSWTRPPYLAPKQLPSTIIPKKTPTRVSSCPLHRRFPRWDSPTNSARIKGALSGSSRSQDFDMTGPGNTLRGKIFSGFWVNSWNDLYCFHSTFQTGHFI